jgi:ribonuclease PH
MTALKGGVALGSVMRPVGETKVTCKCLGVEEKRDDRVEVLEG